MRPSLLSRFLVLAVTCTLVAAFAGDVFAQTQQLNKTLERRFPSGFCPLPSVAVLGTFVTDTGHIQLTFVTPNGYDDGLQFVHHQQQLDNISIVEATYFNANAVDNEDFCYSDDEWGIVKTLLGDLSGIPQIPYYDTFSPSPGPCEWDQTDGATITGGVLELGSLADGLVNVSTSIVISGLTPGVPYVIHGDWRCEEFNILLNCTGAAICMQVTVDDLPNGCGPLPARESTWGAVKALYQN